MSSALIAVDMTPLGPGGQNGGAGVVATSLARHVARLRPGWDLVLLTSAASDAEVRELEANNVRCVLARADAQAPGRGVARAMLGLAPPRLRVKAKSAVWRMRHSARDTDLVDKLQPDLLFCPLTAPYYVRRGLPTVAVVHDLQHQIFPQHFSDEQRLYRDEHLDEICRSADRIVCVSEHVRETLLRSFPTARGRAVTIHHGLLHDFTENDSSALDRLGLRQRDYLLYPANFWPHKNHLRLFEALSTLRERDGPGLQLVCTGTPNPAMATLQRRATELLGDGRVGLPGFLTEGEFTRVLDGCSALIYPSLYEGFGMPVLEAMARGKPVLCSNVSSLPEVAGDAATYFDPSDAADIARAIESLRDRPSVHDRVVRGRERAASFGDATDMAQKYVDLFEDVLDKR